MTHPGIISETEGQDLLAPIAINLRSAVDAAFATYLSDFAPRLPLATPTTRANILHDLILGELRRRWPDDFMTAGGRQLLKLGQGILMQVKKLNPRRLPSNYKTVKAVMFARQLPLMGMPRAVRLTLGYSINALGTQLSEITVLCQTSFTRAGWYYDLMDAVAPIKQLSLAAPAPKVRKLKAKAAPKTKTQSNE